MFKKFGHCVKCLKNGGFHLQNDDCLPTCLEAISQSRRSDKLILSPGRDLRSSTTWSVSIAAGILKSGLDTKDCWMANPKILSHLSCT